MCVGILNMIDISVCRHPTYSLDKVITNNILHQSGSHVELSCLFWHKSQIWEKEGIKGKT